MKLAMGNLSEGIKLVRTENDDFKWQIRKH